MGLAEKLELLVTLDPSQGVAGLEKMSQAAETHGKKTEDALGRVGVSAMKMGVAGLAAGAFLTQLGDKEKQAAGGLEAAISAAGQSVDDYRDRIEEAVKSGEKFGHNAVDTNNALNTLVGSFGDTGVALDQMQLVEDLAAKKHISLADAAQIVAKAHGGAGRIFKEFNIQVGENADGTKNYDAALGELSQKLSGQASASMSGFSGWLSKTTAQVEDQVAQFGEKYGPAIMAGSAALTAFGAISSGVSSILGKLTASRLADAAAAETEEAATVGLSATLGIGLVAALGAAIFMGTQMNQSFSDMKFNVAGLATLTTEQMSKVAASFKDGSKNFGPGGVIDAGSEELKALEDQLVAGDIPAAEKFADAEDQAGISSVGLRQKIEAKRATDKQAAIDQKAYTDAQDAGTDATKAQAKATDEAAKAVQGYGSFISELAGAMDKSYQSTLTSTKLSSSYATAVNSLEDSLKKNGTTLDIQADKYGHFNEKALANQSAVLGVGESIAKLIEQRFQDTHSIDAAVQAGDLYVEGLKQQLSAAGYNTDQIAEMIRTMNLTPEQIRSEFSNNAIEQQIVVGKYLAQLKDIPADQRTDIEAMIEQGKLDEANAALNNVAHGRNVYYTPHVNESTATLIINNKPGAQFADGGLVPGPKGSPLHAVVHGGEFVLTAAQVDAATRGGGSSLPGIGGAPVEVRIAIDARGAQMGVAGSIVDALTQELRSGVTVPVVVQQAFAL